MDPNNVMFRTDLCYAYTSVGRKEEARKFLVQVEADREGAHSVHVPPMALAGMYASLGEADMAFEWLEKALAEHSPYLCSLKVERWFDGIRSDPRYLSVAQIVRPCLTPQAIYEPYRPEVVRYLRVDQILVGDGAVALLTPALAPGVPAL